MTELMRELDVRIPVMGRAEESRGRNCRLGFFNRPPLAKYQMPERVKERDRTARSRGRPLGAVQTSVMALTRMTPARSWSVLPRDR